MPRKYRFNQQYMKGGSQCRGNLAVNNVCQQTVDVNQYKVPCQSLPLDSGFNQTGGEVHQKECSQTVDISQYKTPCQSLPLDPVFNQTGGEYNYITNPKTGRKVSIYGKIGKKVLSKYLNSIFL
jgi:hypothetical protein